MPSLPPALEALDDAAARGPAELGVRVRIISLLRSLYWLAGGIRGRASSRCIVYGRALRVGLAAWDFCRLGRSAARLGNLLIGLLVRFGVGALCVGRLGVSGLVRLILLVLKLCVGRLIFVFGRGVGLLGLILLALRLLGLGRQVVIGGPVFLRLRLRLVLGRTILGSVGGFSFVAARLARDRNRRGRVRAVCMRIVDGNDDVHAGVDLRSRLQAVGAKQRLRRHPVAAREAVSRITLDDQHRRAANRSPATRSAAYGGDGGGMDRSCRDRRRRRERRSCDRARIGRRLIGGFGGGICGERL